MHKQEIIDTLKVQWYNWLCLNQPSFKLLGLDERGTMVDCIVDCIMKHKHEIV